MNERMYERGWGTGPLHRRPQTPPLGFKWFTTDSPETAYVYSSNHGWKELHFGAKLDANDIVRQLAALAKPETARELTQLIGALPRCTLCQAPATVQRIIDLAAECGAEPKPELIDFCDRDRREDGPTKVGQTYPWANAVRRAVKFLRGLGLEPHWDSRSVHEPELEALYLGQRWRRYAHEGQDVVIVHAIELAAVCVEFPNKPYTNGSNGFERAWWPRGWFSLGDGFLRREEIGIRPRNEAKHITALGAELEVVAEEIAKLASGRDVVFVRSKIRELIEHPGWNDDAEEIRDADLRARYRAALKKRREEYASRVSPV